MISISLKSICKNMLALFVALSFVLVSPNIVHAEPSITKPVPSYAKWGVLAMQELSKKYPNAVIKDYSHIGRREVSPTTAEETFKLWMRGEKEFGVNVRILFNTTNDEVISINFEETDR